MKLAMLHLSDIHIKTPNDKILLRSTQIAQALNPIVHEIETLLILVSGDIAQSGSKAEYALATEFFRKLEETVRNERDLPIHWVLVPGNHDGTFKESKSTRNLNIAGVLEHGEGIIDDDIIDTCTLPQANYFEFEEPFSKDNCIFHDKLWKQFVYPVGDRKISISAINASWISQVPEEQGKLVFPLKRYANHARTEADISIAVMHHPLNWYAQTSYHPLREFLARNYCLVLSGHEHINNVVAIENLTQAKRIIMLEAGALWPHKSDEPSQFAVLELEVNTGDLTHTSYTWEDASNAYTPNSGDQQRHCIVPLRKTNFEPTDEMKEALEDLGAPFTHPYTEKLNLSDVYVYPVLRKFDFEHEDSDTISSETICAAPAAIEKIIFRGDDHHGKTSLLYRLYPRCLAAGLVPVLMSARDLLNVTKHQYAKSILEAVRNQYGSNTINAFQQLSKDKKVLLLDDLDRVPMKGDSHTRALKYIDSNFGHIVITVGERFEATTLLSPETTNLLSTYDDYRILGFTFALRSELISKWYRLNPTIAEEELQRRIHEAETQVDAAIGKAILPSTPFNTLMILQNLETTQKTELVDVGLAQYYELLIRRRLVDSGAKKKTIDEIYTYLAGLAWHFREKGTSLLDKSDIAEFNKRHSEEVHVTNLEDRLDLLVRAKILQQIDSAYRFRYPYARYYFLAHYIAENLEERPDLKEAVLHACRHLYLRENANLVLFLTHKSASKWIVREVSAILQELLADAGIFNVEKDSKTLNKWIGTTARLAVDTSNIEKNRREQRERDDEANKIKEDEPNGEVESVKKLNELVQLNLVFKTSEILGLILKSRYGSLGNTFKSTLLIELFNGPLRAISFFMRLVNDKPEALINMMSQSLEKKLPRLTKEQRDNAAQRFIVYTLGAYAHALISRQGEIIGSPDLEQVIKNFIEQESKNEKNQDEKNEPGRAATYKLVSVAARLSYPGGIPYSEIERLANEFKTNGNVFGFNLLQGLVAQHLYMFSLPYDARQKLAEFVNLDLKKQIVSEIKSQDEKRLTSKEFKPRHPKSLIMRLTNSYLAKNPIPESTTKTNKKEDSDKQ